MKPSKTTLILCALSGLSGLGIGLLIGPRSSPIHDFRANSADRALQAQFIIQTLIEARSGNTAEVVAQSESNLDDLILKLAPSKSASGIAFQTDKATLQTISKYRASVSYSPDPKIRDRVLAALN
jgi:hypothetical protein